jgi:hypothetical protein
LRVHQIDDEIGREPENPRSGLTENYWRYAGPKVDWTEEAINNEESLAAD